MSTWLSLGIIILLSVAVFGDIRRNSTVDRADLADSTPLEPGLEASLHGGAPDATGSEGRRRTARLPRTRPTRRAGRGLTPRR